MADIPQNSLPPPKGIRYRQLPKNKDGSLNRQKLHDQYFAFHGSDWGEFCSTYNYNPESAKNRALPIRHWVIQKKQRLALANVKAELEERAIELGAKGLLSQLRAVKEMPEMISGVIQIAKYQIAEFGRQINYDQKHEAEYQKQLIEWQLAPQTEWNQEPPKRRFRAYTTDILCLMKCVTEGQKQLYEALGIDMSAGLKPEQYIKMVEETANRIEPVSDDAPIEFMNIGVIGSNSAETAMAEAMERYLDKPRNQVQQHEEVHVDVENRYDREAREEQGLDAPVQNEDQDE